MTIALSGNDLTFEQLYAVALRGEKVSLAGDAVERMKASRAVVDRVLASGATAYGINTGFGKLASVRISSEQVRQLQVNLVRSHASGVGLPLSEAETRAMMLLRAKRFSERLERHSPSCSGNALRDAQRWSASGDSFARFSGRVGRLGAARTSRARGDRRRSRRTSRRIAGRCRGNAAREYRSCCLGSKRRIVAA